MSTPAPILSYLTRGLIVFWAVWFTLVFLTNAGDAGLALGLLDEHWTFASGNYKFLESKTARYAAPPLVNAVLFAGVIAWEGLSAGLFWRACLVRGRDAARLALVVSLGLWAAFLIADEIVIAYDVSKTHLLLFIATLATLFTVEFLSDCPAE